MKNLGLLCLLVISFAIYGNGFVKQGITGKIYVRKSNYMPAPGHTQGAGRTLEATIAIYELTNITQAHSPDGTSFDHITTKLVAQTRSDKNGQYSIALPPGIYSVFTAYNGSMYANNQDDKGNINAVAVKKDSVTICNISVSAQSLN